MIKGVTMNKRIKSPSVCLLLTVAWLLLSTTAYAATVKGKATVNAEAQAGVEILAYPAGVLTFEAPAAHISAATANDGLFSLELPEGQYYLLARGEALSAYYGRNPITVPQKGLENVNLLLTADNLPEPQEAPAIETGIVGSVSLGGRPVQNAIVTVYPDLSSQLKGMGLGMAAPTDQQGYFELPLSSGTYYLVVRVRQSGQMVGPLQAGDLFGYLPGNPLVLPAESLARVHIPLIEVPAKAERHAASLFGNTLVTGRVLDLQGTPVAGIKVLLYDDPMSSTGHFSFHGKPAMMAVTNCLSPRAVTTTLPLAVNSAAHLLRESSMVATRAHPTIRLLSKLARFWMASRSLWMRCINRSQLPLWVIEPLFRL